MQKLPASAAIWISNRTDIYYLTGLTGASPDVHEYYLVLCPGHAYLYTNSLYLEAAEHQIRLNQNIIFDQHTIPISIGHISGFRDFCKNLKGIAHSHHLKTLFIDDSDTRLDEYLQLKKYLGKVSLKFNRNFIKARRISKRLTEIRAIRRAAELTDQCFNYLVPKIHPGITEGNLARKITAYFRSHHAQPAFEPIVAFDTHTSQPHYTSSDKCKLKSHSMILVDFGARTDGYDSDMTRMIFMGNPNHQIQKAYRTVKLAQEKVIGAISTHTLSGAKLDRMAKSYIRKAGFVPYSHGLGHGVGLEIHEDPRLTIRRNRQIEVGMTFTIEPAIYLPGQFGIRIEDTVYYSNEGLEILTKTPKELLIMS